MHIKRCFFIGHRRAPQELRPMLKVEVERHIAEYGVTEFIVGHYGDFDRMAADAVIDAKEKYPHISLLMLLPYHPTERIIKIPEGFDGTYYPEGMEKVPRSLAIVRANRCMTDRSDYLIAYAYKPGGNARELVEYARKRERRGLMVICNLADDIQSRRA